MTEKIIAADLNKAIDAWGSKGKKWVEEGQRLSIQALTVLKDTGDIGPVNRLIVVMPKGTKKTSMFEYLLAFGSLKANDDKTTQKDKPVVYAKDKPVDLTGAAQKPWFEFSPDPEVLEVFDLQKAIAALIAKGGKAKEVSNPELFDALCDSWNIPNPRTDGPKAEEPAANDDDDATLNQAAA